MGLAIDFLKTEIPQKEVETPTEMLQEKTMSERFLGEVRTIEAEPTKKPFGEWALEKGIGVGELAGHLGLGALSFFPSIIAGTSAIVQEKGKNLILRGMMLDETDPGVRERMQAEVKTPTQIRQAVDRAASFLPGLIGEPKTELAKHGMELADIFLSDIMFYYPKQADEKLVELGYPNLGFMVSSLGEILFAKIYHSGAVEGVRGAKGFSSTISRYKKVVEDASKAETPAQIKTVSQQVDKLLDKLDIKPEERIAAAQTRFRGQDVGSWMEERARARGEEAKYAKEVAREVKEAGKEERPVTETAEEIRLREVEKGKEEALEPVKFIGIQRAAGEAFPIVEATTGRMKGGQIDFDPTRHRVVNLAEYEKAVAEVPPTVKFAEEVLVEKPFVQKPNIAEQYGKDVANEVSYGRTVAEDMGIYETIRAAVEAKKPVGAVMKEIKSERYYKEDLKDFGYNEKDIRAAVRSVKVEEFGDKKIASEISKRLEKELTDTAEATRRTAIREKKAEAEVKAEVEELPKKPKEEVDVAELIRDEDMFETAEYAPEVKAVGKLERVDPERGRPPGVEADLTEYRRPTDVEALIQERKIRVEAEQAPLETPGGKTIKSLGLAKRQAKAHGLEGTVTKHPSGEGYYMKKSPEQRAVAEVLEQKFWEDVLADEAPKKAPEGMFESLTEMFESERGSVIIEPETIKRLQMLVDKGRASVKDVVATMKRKKIPDSQILKAFPNAFAETLAKGESKWLKKGQDPDSLLPARIIQKGKGKKRPAPRVTRRDAHIVGTFEKNLKSPFFHENLRLGTSEGLFTELGPKMKETFLYLMRTADKDSTNFVTALVKESNALKKTFKLGTRQKTGERIGIYEIAQQLDGVERLKAQGVKESQIPKKLMPKEQVVYDRFQLVYKRLYKLLNNAREVAGETKFPAVKNYSAWFHDFSRALEIDRLSPLDSLMRLNNSVEMLKKIPSRIDRLGRTPGMKGHEKFRGGPETPGFLRLDTFDNFNTYAKIAGDTIHKGPTTAYLHELLLKEYGLADRAPNTWRFLSEWLDFQKGRDPIMWVENPTTRRWIREGSSNVAVSYISYVWSSILNQVSSIPNSGMLIGYPRLIQGFMKAAIPRQYKRATRVSDVLITRSPEAVLMESGRPYPLFPGRAGRTISDVWGKTRTAGTGPLMIVDDIVAHGTWLGAEAKAKRIYKSSKTYKEMPEAKKARALQDFTKHYADDRAVQAQGSAARAERAPIQRTAEGAAATTLQTFVIANFDLLKRHMLGIGHPDLPKRVMVQRMMRYVIGYSAVAYAFDFMGMRSPNPRPVKIAKEELEKIGGITDLGEFAQVATAVGKELVEFYPIIGGKFKYGSEFGGALLNEVIKLAGGDMTAIPRLQGMPGFQQMLKSYRAAKKDGGRLDIVFGRYVE